MTEEPDLDAAYDLKSPEDAKRLYRTWAESYDADFRVAQGYDYAARIAEHFDAEWAGDGPVLDVGCGTGAVAETLRARPVDGLDISPEMLGVAKAKGLYRDLIEADMTARLPLPDGAYAGVVSAGTFTHGHVGPEAFDELVRVTRPGALFVAGINGELFEAMNFAAVFDRLTDAGLIEPPRYAEGRIYAKGAGHEHEDDLYRAAIFRRR